MPGPLRSPISSIRPLGVINWDPLSCTIGQEERLVGVVEKFRETS